MLRFAMSACVVAAGLYAALCVALFLGQFRLIYLPTRGSAYTPADAGFAFEDLTLETADGEHLHAWFVPAPAGTASGLVVLFAHGNGGAISDRPETIAQLRGLGVDTLLFDYRGYGRSTGSPDEAGTYADIEAAYRWLRDARRVSADRIVVMGRSLGGGPAAWLAEQHDVGGLILESTFTSVPDVAARRYRGVPVRWLARVHDPTIDRMSRIDVPVLVVHSRHDETIPYAHGRALYEAARQPRTFAELEGPHGSGFLDSGRRYTDALTAFFEQVSDARARK